MCDINISDELHICLIALRILTSELLKTAVCCAQLRIYVNGNEMLAMKQTSRYTIYRNQNTIKLQHSSAN
jgi:hypothetical protein